MSIFSFLGLRTGTVKEALKKGAIIVDVRTATEYDQGRVPESVNIPVDRVAASAERIKGMKRVVFCCATGARSGTATRIMKEKGMKEVYNGGSWKDVLRVIKSM